jgi:hypothetical protein
MPGGHVCSASMKATWPTVPSSNVWALAHGDLPIRKLFSKEQRAFYETHAPAGIALDDLSILGPILVLKLKFSPRVRGRKAVAEVWNYPDFSRVLEFSTRTAPADAFETAVAAREFMAEKGISLEGTQQTKTRTALEYFSTATLGRAGA